MDGQRFVLGLAESKSRDLGNDRGYRAAAPALLPDGYGGELLKLMTGRLDWWDGRKLSPRGLFVARAFTLRQTNCFDLAEMGRSVLRPYTKSSRLEWFGVGG
jgi:hypothetical protein